MAQAAPQGQGFVVRPFAVMKLTHDAIRFQIASFEKAFSAENIEKLTENDLEGYEKDWLLLARCIDIHAKQENDVFFPFLRELSKKLNKDENVQKCFVNNENDNKQNEDLTSFFGQHTHDDAQRAAITQAFQSKDKNAVSKAMLAWIADHLKHLKGEEEVMMPMTPLTADTVEKRGGIVRNILNIDRKEFSEFQFGYVLGLLVKRKRAWCAKDSGKEEKQKKQSKGSLKMYCLGVQMASNKEEYEQVKGLIKDIMDDAEYQMFKDGIEKDGKQ